MLCEVSQGDEGVWVVAVWVGFGVQVSSEGGGDRLMVHTIKDFRGDNVWRDETGTMWVREDELEAAVKAAAARVVELEAVIEKVREAARENALDGELFYSTWHVDRALALAPPVVLADRDAAVWDQGYEAGADDEAFIARGLDTDPGAGDIPHANPYRGDNR